MFATRDRAALVYGQYGGDPPAEPAAGDFAQCPLELPACTDTLTTCCKRPFDPIGQDKALVIPMDRCHQQMANGGPLSPPDEDAPEWCREMGTRGDDGIIEAYGLVYRLMQRGIPVYWLINPSKSPQGRGGYTATDVDAWILSSGATPPEPGEALAPCAFFSCVSPINRLDPDTLEAEAGYDRQQFPLRGSAWVIAPEDRPAFDQFWLDTVVPARGDYDFKDVDLYEVQGGATFAYQAFHQPDGTGYTVVEGAPVALRVDYPPPRLAKLSGGPSDNWLALAKLDQRATNSDCLSADFQPADAVYCDISAADVSAGRLNTNDIDWAWMDAGGFSCSDVEEFREFLSADGDQPGRSMLLMEGVIEDIESCSGREIMGRVNGGLAVRNPSVAGPFVQRYPANVMLQYGDIEADFAQGSVSGWYVSSNGSAGYEPRGTLVRLVTKDEGEQCANNQSTPTCDTADDEIDVLTYVRHDDEPQNGVAMYAPGNNLVPANNRAHLRVVLNALIALPTSTGQVPDGDTGFFEVARSTPIVTPVGNQLSLVQGSFEYPLPLPPREVYEGAADDASFTFPHIRGHFRAIVASDLGLQAQTFDTPTAVFDVAAGGIPTVQDGGCGDAAFTGACRTVFTNTASGRLPEQVTFDRSSVADLEPLLEADLDLTAEEAGTLISRVLAGSRSGEGVWEPALGGVDRSTTAVIGASQLIGGERPTIAYFGGLDGMLHAVCASLTAPCDALGRELWAYIPRTQLPRLRSNSQRIDGSPIALDAAGDFDGDGSFEIRTVLAFATGSGDATNPAQAPAVVGLDVTDPTKPRVLWEVVTAGQGVRLAASPVRVGNVTKNLIFATTNRGADEAGVVVYAIDASSGEVQWRFDHVYPEAREEGGPGVPKSGIPAGPSAVDLDNVGFATHVVVPTLFGEVLLLQADSGINEYGSEPLFSFSTDFHPIGAPAAIYLDATNTPFAIIGSGGYADPLGVTGWAPDDARQYIVSFSLKAPLANAPLNENSQGELIGFVDELGPGERVFAQPTIAGGELFVVTDSEDINDLPAYAVSGGAGALRRYDLATGAQKGSTETLSGGASSVNVRDGVVYSASGTGAQRIDVSANFDADGAGVEVTRAPRLRRQMWLQTH